jgi:transcriptional regulator with XRE-family HTH domain
MWGMPTQEQLENLGREMRSWRKAAGEKSLRKFAKRIGVSPTHVSQLERAYSNPKQGITVPSDDVLEKIADGLNVPVSRMHLLLGRCEGSPYPALQDPEALDVAERFARLPDYARRHLHDVLTSLETLVATANKTSKE